MDSTAIQNRLLAAPIAALLGPLIEQKLGVKLTDEQLIGLIAAAPVIYHALAAFGQKCAIAFVLYFPPRNPQQGPTAPKVTP
jgi:hypothetical protein